LKATRDHVTFRTLMIETFYLHLEFTTKNGGWSINLPFLCTRCGVCCTLNDFLTAGPINAKPEEHKDVHAKINELCEELGKMWAADEAKYDDYTIHTRCPFLVENVCSIYEIRPDGCQAFPKTVFGMQTQDCPALNRFKKQRSALEKGKIYKEEYHFIGKTSGSIEHEKSIEIPKFTEKQYQKCITKLCAAGITPEELALFNYFNGRNMG